MSVDSRRCLAVRTWSVGLRAAPPSSISRFWILSMLYTLDNSTTRMVPATLFTMRGPRPRFNRSNPMITSFLNGVLNSSTAIIAASMNTTRNSNWIIFVTQTTTTTITTTTRNDPEIQRLEFRSLIDGVVAIYNSWMTETQSLWAHWEVVHHCHQS